MAKKTLAQKKKDPRSKYWKTKADALWGAVIHEIYQSCPVDDECAGHIEAHHLIGRANTATRHRIENGIGLCTKHHQFSPKLSAHGAPLAFAEWLQKRHPDRWEWCSEYKHKIQKPDYIEAQRNLEIVRYLQNRLKKFVETTKNAIKDNPDNAMLYYQLGNLLQKRSQNKSVFLNNWLDNQYFNINDR